jgi:hypothetical protein
MPSCAKDKIQFPDWLDELFLRFTAIYRGKWTYGLQDERMLVLTQYEWFEALKGFDEQLIMEVTTDVKKIYKDVPAISEFVEIAKSKEKLRTSIKTMEERERNCSPEKILNHKVDPQLVEDAKESIRRLCKKMSRAGA